MSRPSKPKPVPAAASPLPAAPPQSETIGAESAPAPASAAVAAEAAPAPVDPTPADETAPDTPADYVAPSPYVGSVEWFAQSQRRQRG